MSFANERESPAVSLRVRYYFIAFIRKNFIGLSKFYLGDFFNAKGKPKQKPFKESAFF